MNRDNSNITHCVIYRMGGTDRYTWKYSIHDSEGNSEIRAGEIRKMGFLAIVVPTGTPLPTSFKPCRAVTDHGTNARCLKPATVEDENFAYALCEDHAQSAYACMDIDDQMLANAY